MNFTSPPLSTIVKEKKVFLFKCSNTLFLLVKVPRRGEIRAPLSSSVPFSSDASIIQGTDRPTILYCTSFNTNSNKDKDALFLSLTGRTDYIHYIFILDSLIIMATKFI
jgi:hypothetical protein